MKTQYTQGPWLVNPHNIRDEHVRVLIERQIEGTNTYVVDEIIIATANEDLTNYRANARLIAAAPDMLAACEAILQKWDFHDVTQDELSAEDINIYNMFSKAVQKAKGGV